MDTRHKHGQDMNKDLDMNMDTDMDTPTDTNIYTNIDMDTPGIWVTTYHL
jgi:hypothetical protein